MARNCAILCSGPAAGGPTFELRREATVLSNRDTQNRNELLSWLPPILFLFVFPPVGVLLLVIKLFGLSRRRGNTAVKRHPADLQRAAPQAAAGPSTRKKGQDNIPDGRSLILWGGIATAVFGLASLSVISESLFWLPDNLWWFLEDTLAVLCFLGASLGVLLYGLKQRKMGRRFRTYLNLIGKRSQVSLETMCQVSGVKHRVLVDDLQEMLDRGVLPAGYLDLLDDRLVLSDEGIPDQPGPETKSQENTDLSREDAILAEIRQLNDDIAQPRLSAQIDEIEEITCKIFLQLKENPDKAPQLRSFLNYYLPTTLKILHSYAQLESQGIEGDNITAAKARIEGMMDKVVEGFEHQLDRLFEHDAMDITADVNVLEKMLRKDGLSGGGLEMKL